MYLTATPWGYGPILSPCHRTGWKALQAIAAAMPEAYVHNAVGTTYLC
jgi:metal-dependent hydrolase (beta-lactamase superfamily II)